MGRAEPQHDKTTLLGKVARLLACVASDEPGAALGLSELSRQSGISKATTFRLAEELSALRLLERTETGYRLGPWLFELGERVPRFYDLVHVAAPFAEDLHQATGQTVHFGVLDDDQVIYLLKVRGHKGVDKPSRVAGRMPAHCTASGRAILALADPAVVRSIMSQGLEPITRHTIVHPPAFLQQLQKVRELGVATETEEVALGWGAIAAPVVDASGPVAAIGVVVRTAEGHPERFRTAVRTSALYLSRILGRHSNQSGDRDPTRFQGRS